MKTFHKMMIFIGIIGAITSSMILIPFTIAEAANYQKQQENYLGQYGTVVVKVDSITCLMVDAMDRYYDDQDQCWITKQSFDELNK